MNKLNTNTNFLKIIAIISMLIDHIGVVFFPTISLLRAIGRIAFPIFLYSTFIGYFKTKNLKKYIIRLLIIAIISQPIYILLFNIYELNICFTLIISLIFLYLLDHKKYIFYIIIFLLCMPFISYVSYLPMIMFLTPIMYYTRNNRLLFISGITLFYLLMIYLGMNSIYIYSLLFIPLILINIKHKIKINKYFFYLFYPIHLLILLIIKLI